MTSTPTEHALSVRPVDWNRPARKTALTITDPELDALYAQSDVLLRLLTVALAAGAAE